MKEMNELSFTSVGRRYIPQINNLVDRNPTKYLGMYKGYLEKVLENCGVILGAFDKDTLVAFSVLEVPSVEAAIPYNLRQVPKITRENYSMIGDTLVDKDYRGNGIQRKLTTELFKFANDLDMKYIFTLVNADNEVSLNNLIESGMTELAQVKRQSEVRLIMMKSL